MVNRTTESDYIEFTGNSTKCTSHVGRRGGMPITLEPNANESCFRAMTIVQEIYDEYIEIVWENVQEGYERYFKIYWQDRVTHCGVSYDYDSEMHYGPTAGSISSSKPTMIARKNLGGLVMGHRLRSSSTLTLELGFL